MATSRPKPTRTSPQEPRPEKVGGDEGSGNDAAIGGGDIDEDPILGDEENENAEAKGPRGGAC